MKNCFPIEIFLRAGCWAGLVLAVMTAGCNRARETRWQGYLEGEFVYVGAPLSGRLEMLGVSRGERVETGAVLFELERGAEEAMERQAAEQLRAAEARLEDLRKGWRPSELAMLEARAEQARSGAELAQIEFERLEALRETNVISENDFDRGRIARDRAVEAVGELRAQLETARLGARADAIAAAEADVRAAKAAKERAEWSVRQKTQVAAEAALVYDTLYRAGEFVAAGLPVVALLPPENLKVRFFVPESELAGVPRGAVVRVAMSGREAVEARVVYVSPKPEYTPPVLYNRENRSKLVFMVEAVFDAGAAVELHPGRPVDVTP